MGTYSIFGVMYMLAEYGTFAMANNIAFDKLNTPEWGLVVAGVIISAIGMLMGSLLKRNVASETKKMIKISVFRAGKLIFERKFFMWNELYNAAVKVQNSRTISPFIDAGGVAAAILTKQGNVYVGVCIDTASTLGMCAERNAIANMITNGESQIDKVVAVMSDGTVGSPCGACREYMMQLDKNSGDIEILLDLETKKTVRLKELIPDWWGYTRFNE